MMKQCEIIIGIAYSGIFIPIIDFFGERAVAEKRRLKLDFGDEVFSEASGRFALVSPFQGYVS